MNYSQIQELFGLEIPPNIIDDSIHQPHTHVACIFNSRTGEPIVWGTNERLLPMTVTSGYQQYYNHAEKVVIQKLIKLKHTKRLPKSKMRGPKALISIRISKSGILGQSKVCLGCAGFLVKYANMIDQIIYMDKEKNWQKIATKDVMINATTSSGDKRRHR
jgi:hypothetical protein